jgi:hypothetical protein
LTQPEDIATVLDILPGAVAQLRRHSA